jgi:hypothetical protein
MGNAAVKKRQQEASAKKRKATNLSVASDSEPPAQTSTATDTNPQSEDQNNAEAPTAAKERKKPVRKSQKKAKVTTVTSTRTRSRSVSTALTSGSNSKASPLVEMALEPSLAPDATHTDGNQPSEGRPFRASSAAVRTFISQIALSNITEQTEDEEFEVDQVTESDESVALTRPIGEYLVLTDDLEDDNVVAPSKKKAPVSKKPAARGRKKAAKKVVVETLSQSEAEDEEGKYDDILKFWTYLIYRRTIHLHDGGQPQGERHPDDREDPVHDFLGHTSRKVSKTSQRLSNIAPYAVSIQQRQ